MRSSQSKTSSHTLYTSSIKTLVNTAAGFLLISISACSMLPLGPVPEPIDADPTTMKGPGFFTGESGEFNVTDFFDPDKRAEKRNRYITVTGSDVDIPAIDLDSFEEFERFKAWRRAQEVGSIEYQDWLDYQQFLRLKAEK